MANIVEGEWDRVPGGPGSLPDFGIPNPRFSGLDGLKRRFNTGAQNFMARLGGAIVPGAPGVAPEMLQQLRNNALLQLGLGLMAGRSMGKGFGESALGAFAGAQGTANEAMQNAYQHALRNRAESRALEREKLEDERYEHDRAHQLEREGAADARWRAEQEAIATWRRDQLTAGQRISPEAGAKLEEERKNERRIAELIAKPTRSESEEIELDWRTGGAVSRTKRATSPFDLGGLGGGFGGASFMPGGNPLLGDPRMNAW